jgi:hypothetical protein
MDSAVMVAIAATWARWAWLVVRRFAVGLLLGLAAAALIVALAFGSDRTPPDRGRCPRSGPDRILGPRARRQARSDCARGVAGRVDPVQPGAAT